MDWLGLVLFSAVGLLSYSVYTTVLRRRGLQVVDASLRRPATAAAVRLERETAEGGESRLSRWLALAGFRRADASERFIAAMAASLVLGFLASWLFAKSGLVERMTGILSAIPGGAGEFLLLMARLGPWTLFAIIVCIPWLAVRSARRERVKEVERDLPLALDLFATLAEAGLGFDAALDRILESQPAGRTLPREFRLYQRDMLAGVPRAQALRRFAKRINITAVTVFVSALVEAEQVGASLAETLRHQAEDLRDRRRSRTMLLAQALPVKLVFPLVICFLPGIFVSTLAPALYQMVKVVDSVLPMRR